MNETNTKNESHRKPDQPNTAVPPTPLNPNKQTEQPLNQITDLYSQNHSKTPAKTSYYYHRRGSFHLLHHQHQHCCQRWKRRIPLLQHSHQQPHSSDAGAKSAPAQRSSMQHRCPRPHLRQGTTSQRRLPRYRQSTRCAIETWRGRGCPRRCRLLGAG